MGRIKKNKTYYGVDQEEAVVHFLNAETSHEKEKIYRESLQEPINKMIESIIRTYKLYRISYEFNDLHADTLSFLMTKFNKFKPEKGKKSYSYFGTVCKNYLYNEMMKEYKRNNSIDNIDDIDPEILNRDDLLYTIDNQDLDLTDFIDKLTDSIKDELNTNNITDNEFKVGHSLVKILEEWKNLFVDDKIGSKNSNKFNKNLILLYIRNMTGLTTKEIRHGIRRYKILYSFFKNKYLED